MPTEAQAAFIKKHVPHAVEATRQTGIFTNIILAQWCHETTYGASKFYKVGMNLAGIKRGRAGGSVIPGTNTRLYTSYEECLIDWLRVIRLSYYRGVLAAKTIDDQVRELGLSPWSEGHYGKPGFEGENLRKHFANVEAVIRIIQL